METLARNGFNNMSLKQRLVKFRLKSNVEKQLPMVFYEKKVFLKISENSQENTCG